MLIMLLAWAALPAWAVEPVLPTAADLEQRRLDLDARKARLEAELAQLEEDRLRLEAARSPAAGEVTTPHDPFAGRLRMARKPVHLLRKGVTVGELPALTVVPAAPAAEPGWIIVQHEGESYEAPAEPFALEEDLLGEARRTESAALRDLELREAEVQKLQEEQNRLDGLVQALESELRHTVVSSRSSSVRVSDEEGRATLVSESSARSTLGEWRRDLRRASRQVELAEQDLYLLRSHWERSRQVRERLESAFTAFRHERTP